MKPAPFSYLRPGTLDEALTMLAQHGDDAAVLAGGQSLMPMLNLRVARPAQIIDIKRLPGLEQIVLDDGRIVIGALARHASVKDSALVRQHTPLLAMAFDHVAHAAIRNRGTFGGSLALADPAAELPACAVCLGAQIVVASKDGERKIAADAFFQGIYTTALASGELILRVEVPVLPEWRWDFDEVARRRGDFAIAGLALGIRLDGGIIAECRVVFCGVESAPRRLKAVEEALAGSQARDATTVRAALKVLERALEPLESHEYPPFYRRRVAGVLLERGLARLAGGVP
jgi:aerobic carbon-monoxide dehydrogenase medium subunit